MIFSISGYFKDDPYPPFDGYLVNEYDDVPVGYTDDQIFFHGLSEENIKEAIELREDTAHDFVITDYEIYNKTNETKRSSGNLPRGKPTGFPVPNTMTYRIHYNIGAFEDYYDLEGDTIKEIKAQNKIEMEKRNLDSVKNNCWAEEK